MKEHSMNYCLLLLISVEARRRFRILLSGVDEVPIVSLVGQ